MAINFVTFVGVDEEHAKELRLSWPTWRKMFPELMERPLVLIVSEGADTAFVDHPDAERFGVEAYESSSVLPVIKCQRARMLNAMTVLPSILSDRYQADYYLKLDTDAVAVSRPCMNPQWFARKPAIIAPPWGYTKPASMLDKLDLWCRDRSLFNHRPIPRRTMDGHKARSDRFISYVCWVNWRWANAIMTQVDGNHIPVPSQDTFLWYCAARLQSSVFRTQMPAWHHTGGRISKLRQLSQEVCSD